MTQQGTLFSPGTANREEAMPIQAKVLARKTDPATSKRAAERKALWLTQGQDVARLLLIAHGPGTTHQIAWQATRFDGNSRAARATALHYELARRFPELERKGLARIQQDPSKPCRCKPNATRCRCRDVVRDGSRVWEVVA